MYGAADLLGGLAARRTNTVAVVLVSQSSGLVALVVLLPWLPDAAPALRDLAWGAVAGIAIGAGLALLYRALAVGMMVVVAPTTAVCAVVIRCSRRCCSASGRLSVSRTSSEERKKDARAMTTEQKIIKTKVGVLDLAKQLGNVARAGRIMGDSRDSFYRFKE